MSVIHQLLIDWNADGDWSDISEDVSADLLPVLTGERGKDQARIFAPPMAGNFAAELINEDQTYNPYATSATGTLLLEDGTDLIFEDASEFLLEGATLDVEPGKLIRWNVNSIPIWTGITEDMSHEIQPQRVRVSALGLLSKYNDRKVSTPLYQSVRTDQALHILFDALGHPTADRDFSSGDSTLDWFWLNDSDPIQVVNDILNTEGAGASFYEDGQGRLIFENRDYRTNNTRSATSQYTFSTLDTVTEFEYHPDYHDITNQCFLDIVEREAQALQEIWALGEDLTLTANQTKEFTIRTGDPFMNARVPSPVPSDAVQTLQPSATLTSGTFKLRFKGETTAAINYNATAATIQTALEGLSTIGTGNVECTEGPINTNAVLVTFVGSLSGQDITDLIEVIESSLNPVSVGATIEASQIQAGGGLFIEVQQIAPSGTLTAGTFTISASYSGGGGTTGNINYNATAATIQTAIRALTGFSSTNCYGGPISTSAVRLHFASVFEDMAEVIVVGSGLMTLAPSATIEVTQSARGGVPDYVLTGGGLLTAKTITPTSGQLATLSLTAGALGATLIGLRVRAQPVTVVRSETVENDNDTSASITKYGERPYSPGIRQEISRATALAVANSFTTYYPNSRPSVTIRTVSAFDDMLMQQLYRRVSDRITIVEPNIGLNGAFWIEQIRHTGDRCRLYTEFGCEKALHGDSHSDTHSDTAHTDSAAHSDSHSDTDHSDTAHADAHTDTATHSDVAHSDSHTDSAHSDVAHTDAHTDDHADSHTDDLHSDDHGDTHTDTAHGDTAHADSAHADSHSDTVHGDSHTDDYHSDVHSDEIFPPEPDHTDVHIDSHSDTHSDTAHSDVAHSDAAHSDDHSDMAHSDVAHGDSHTDSGESTHTDIAHVDVAHGDVAHSDVAHSDDAHSDTHSDVAHADAAHADTHSDVAHSDIAHADSHSDTHSDEA